jgi:hypothetical protein
MFKSEDDFERRDRVERARQLKLFYVVLYRSQQTASSIGVHAGLYVTLPTMLARTRSKNGNLSDRTGMRRAVLKYDLL